MYVIRVRTQVEKISTRNNVKNIALITSMVIRRIKDKCGQVKRKHNPPEYAFSFSVQALVENIFLADRSLAEKL